MEKMGSEIILEEIIPSHYLRTLSHAVFKTFGYTPFFVGKKGETILEPEPLDFYTQWLLSSREGEFIYRSAIKNIVEEAKEKEALAIKQVIPGLEILAIPIKTEEEIIGYWVLTYPVRIDSLKEAIGELTDLLHKEEEEVKKALEKKGEFPEGRKMEMVELLYSITDLLARLGTTAHYLRKNFSYLSLIMKVARVLAERKTLRDGLESLGKTLQETLGIDGGFVRILREGRKLYFLMSWGKQIPPRFTLEVGQPLSGTVVRSGKPINIEDIETSTFSQLRELCGLKGAILILPLKAEGVTVGTLGLLRPHPFSPEEVDLLTALSAEIGTFIEALRTRGELERTIIGIIQSLVKAVEAKDPYTAKHSEKVTHYAELLMEELGLPEEEKEIIRDACLLHDIGKIGISENILRKPAKLNDCEWEIIKSHPVMGEEILKPLPTLKPVLPLIRHHHERWDGKGYPDGLKGEEIPLGARIIAICDAFDAMTSLRPYRKPLSKEKALKEIEKNSGTQFDPKLVEIFLKLSPSPLSL
ncbi:MAG: hypothetical protein DRJ34_04195 [Thermoprotei archaeon]|nr:MAG: hypothetical protein DRJ34_04195 [Thermoprotei archaeon]